MAKASELVRAALIAAEIAVYPGLDVDPEPYTNQMLCFVGPYPSELENILVVSDERGLKFGADMRSGFADQHYGAKVIARTLDYFKGGDMIDRVEAHFAQLARTDYNVRDKKMTSLRVYNVGTSFYIGEEDGTKRHLWALNVRVAMGQAVLEGS